VKTGEVHEGADSEPEKEGRILGPALFGSR
jgi:hypothetical protein